jgi:hypothetical protein
MNQYMRLRSSGIEDDLKDEKSSNISNTDRSDNSTNSQINFFLPPVVSDQEEK